ncbi:MAG: prolyl oligopeptidase family serine peptidase [Terrimonas sp.]|nr:prolyl oligopeptidase family serine peptidase [Terrimonas sp.]
MKKILVPVTVMLVMASCNSNDQATRLTTFKTIEVKYPVTAKDTTVVDNYFGTLVADPYRWLENDTSKATAEWVKAENEVTQQYLSQIPFRDAIRKRYTEIFDYEKYSAPFKQGKYTYYYRNSGLQNQSVLYRESAENKEPEVFLDPNTFSADGTTSLSGIRFSKDGSMAAYNISQGGSDWQKLVVINADTKQQTGDTLDLKFSGASWKGNDGFFYSTYEKPKEGSFLAGVTANHKLYYHKLGTPQSEDQMIFGSDTNPTRYIGGGVSEDEKWLFISTANETYGNGIYVIDLSKPGSPAVPLTRDMKNTVNVIDNDDQYFYIQTDKDAPTGKVVAVPINNPAPENWKTIIEAKPEVLSASTGGGFLFCSYLKDAITRISQYDMTGKLIRDIELPGIGTVGGFGAKKDEKELFYVFTSYTTPPTIYQYDISSGKSSVYKKSEMKFNPDDYESKQVFYTSKDGTKIPMIITYKKGLTLDGNNPCMLYGYGGFGVSLRPSFNTSTVILLENGGVYAVPNLRGGGEYGEDWHKQGIKTSKQNVFDDFIAAAQYLVDNKYTSRNLLAISGGSNGGLLIGACMTQQPGMCKVAFPAVGVMDMLRYHKFTAGAGWSYDYGTSDDNKEMFEYLYGYSPVHNIKVASYPATLVTTADHDDRVVPAHSFKFAATMQEKQNGSNPVLIRIETKAGHGAGKSTKQTIEEQTDKWSFMFYNIGLEPGYK